MSRRRQVVVLVVVVVELVATKIMSSSSSVPSRPVYVPRPSRRTTARNNNSNSSNNNKNSNTKQSTTNAAAGDFHALDTPQGWRSPRSPTHHHHHHHVHHHTHPIKETTVNDPWETRATPEQIKVQQSQSQRPEDFMDEQDHQEWGGPTRVRSDYDPETVTTARVKRRLQTDWASAVEDSTMTTTTATDWFTAATTTTANDNIGLAMNNDSVGRRLLRVLGWRPGGSTAYVPTKDDDDNDNNNNDNNNNNNNDQKTDSRANNDTIQEDPRWLMLSRRRRLRQIPWHHERMVLLPKQSHLSTCGLGFEPLRDAPEFQAHQQRQRQQRQRRNDTRRRIYRVNDVLQGYPSENDDEEEDADHSDHNVSRHPASTDRGDTRMDDAYLAHHHPDIRQDLVVGTKASSGLALRDDDVYDDDDDDDVYDSPGRISSSRLDITTAVRGHPNHTTAAVPTKKKRLQVDQEAYETVAYEHQDSDDDDNDHHHHHHPGEAHGGGVSRGFAASGPSKVRRTITAAPVVDLSGALAAFVGQAVIHTNQVTANGNATASATTSIYRGFTSDGRPPLAGFVLGGATSLDMPRFRGPDVPTNYQIQRHVFGPNDHPLVLKALSHAVQLEVADQRKQAATQDALQSNQIVQRRPKTTVVSVPAPVVATSTLPASPPPLAGLLSTTMKDRFTPARNDDPTTQPSIHRANEETAKVAEAQPVIAIHRTVHSFVPANLLCKRFQVMVPVPKAHEFSGKPSPTTTMSEKRTTGQVFLDSLVKEIQSKKVSATKKTEAGDETLASVLKASSKQPLIDEPAADDGLAPPMTERPAMEIYKSIFEPDSDMDSSGNEQDADNKDLDNAGTDNFPQNQEQKPALDTTNQPEASSPPWNQEELTGNTEGRIIPYNGKRSAESFPRNERQSRSRSPLSASSGREDSEDDDDDDDDSRRRRRSKKRRRRESKRDKRRKEEKRRKKEKKKKKKKVRSRRDD